MSQLRGKSQSSTTVRHDQQEGHLGWKLPQHSQGWASQAHHPSSGRATLTEATGPADTDSAMIDRVDYCQYEESFAMGKDLWGRKACKQSSHISKRKYT